MANTRIGIDPNLTPVKEYLENKGYIVESINFREDFPRYSFNNYDAFVITGLNKDFMGILNTGTQAVVIDATGLTPDQVYRKVQMRLLH